MRWRHVQRLLATACPLVAAHIASGACPEDGTCRSHQAEEATLLQLGAAAGRRTIDGARRAGPRPEACPSYETISTPKAQQLNFSKFEGLWWEVTSRNFPFTANFSCTRYELEQTGPTTFNSTLKAYDTWKEEDYKFTNEGSWDEEVKGALVENYGKQLNVPVWVLNYWEDYSYAILYECVGGQEFVEYLSRTKTMPPEQRTAMDDYLQDIGISIKDMSMVPMTNCKDLASPCGQEHS